ncbi:hypothetical protein ZHAS_00021692 [Anopheles sinensis]|uniref:Ionotropic glutamate receptor L-glutamate and glycine-binding domain-containing protein n=1 Tax=Anopheles sinensis TaxID=74873 RepID=A0A084WT35_ANOSI|nr:hypothetical protein ZHAS_00021692 [Anopheles sinensis]
MYYGVLLTKTFVFHSEECDIVKVFGPKRALPLTASTLTFQVMSSFPYTYRLANNSITGLDLLVFRDIFDHVKSVPVNKFLDTFGYDAMQVKKAIVWNLVNGQVDFMLSRMSVDYGRFESIFIPEHVDICLVVPRSFRADLMTSVMRPFDNSVWVALGLVVGVFQLKKVLLKTNSMIGRALALLERHSNWKTFTTIGVEWISFVLIENYLAQVTSFFLNFRLEPDPETLEQFFATNIAIRLPAEQLHILDYIEPTVAEAIRQRAVGEKACREFSDRCAHLDRSMRAKFIIKYHQPIDPSSGAKRSYILKETVLSKPWTYVFARGSPLKDLFEVYLQQLFEAGLPQWYKRTVINFVESPEMQYEKSLQLEHLTSIWVFIVAGWGVAMIVFLMERVIKLKLFK